MSKIADDQSIEYWQMMRPGCGHITYFRVHGSPRRFMCQCGKWFAKREAELYRFGVCSKIDSPSSLQKRQSVDVYDG